jgi:flagellar hook-length control protein FliK
VRSEHAQAAGQRETVVVERTTIQALPEQALRGARFLVNNTEQTMRIRLMPESLGEVRLEVVAAKGDVTVKLASANAAVREILQTHAPGLQHAIAQDNTGNVRVTVSADVGSSAWLSSNANRNNGQQDPNAQAQANHRSATPSLYRDANPTTTATPRREAAHAGNLNVYA